MRNLLKTLTLAGLLAASATAASAQGINFRIGVGDDRPTRSERIERRSANDDVVVRRRVQRNNDDVVVRRRIVEPRTRVIERRVVRPAARTVCRTEIRRTFRSNGRVVTRPVQICRQVGPSRRVIIR
jgi:hypothetical protein